MKKKMWLFSLDFSSVNVIILSCKIIVIYLRPLPILPITYFLMEFRGFPPAPPHRDIILACLFDTNLLFKKIFFYFFAFICCLQE